MKIFISWSGEKSQSQRVAEALKKWLPCVLQYAKPYVSSADIDKGARWSADLAKELQDTSFGILCVTKESLPAPWLNFEAGALSKLIDTARVCPFLVGIKPSDIQNSPILQFQMTTSVKDDVFKLVETINHNAGDAKLDETVLRTTFNMFWPTLESALNEASAISDAPTSEESEGRASPSHIEEILNLVRYQQKLLNSPKDLLPPEYLLEVFSGIGNPLLGGKIAEGRSAAMKEWIVAEFIPVLQSVFEKVHGLADFFTEETLSVSTGNVYSSLNEILVDLMALRIRATQMIGGKTTNDILNEMIFQLNKTTHLKADIQSMQPPSPTP